MNLELSAEQVELRDTVRRFLAERAAVASHVRPLLDDATGTTDELWRGLADLGATGLLVPERHGGAGLTMIEAGLVAEELGRALHPGPWLSTAIAATRVLDRVGDPVVAPDLLARIAEGSCIVTVALASPSQPLGIERIPDGAVLHGELRDVADAAAAHVLLVLADDQLFAVNSPAPRDRRLPRSLARATPVATIDATRKRFTVALDGARADLVAPAPTEAVAAYEDDVLIAWAADAIGAAQALVDLTIEYAKVRQQFGQPIGAFQAVQHLCVDMYERVELARGGVLKALWAADHAGPEERHLAAVRCKAFSGRLAEVGDTAIQVLAGIGFTWEHDAHLYLRRLLSWSAFRGAPDIHLRELGTRLARSVRP